MGQNTAIEWATHTANPWWGCVEVSALCDNCYAREWARRYDRAKWGADEPRLTIKSVWKDLAKWQRDAAAAGRVDRVFCGSMMDIFERPMPVVDAKGERVEGITTGDLRGGMFNEVVPASPNLLFLFLTKRPSNIPKYIPDAWHSGAPANVMFGTSIGTRKCLPQIDHLRAAPGRQFLSIEPLLEDLGDVDLSGIEWVVAGGESGPRARPSHPDWFRRLRDRCEREGVAFMFKQWGEWVGSDHPVAREWPARHEEMKAAGKVHVWPRAMPPGPPHFAMNFNLRVGKKAAGRLLDGREWNGLPRAEVQLAR